MISDTQDLAAQMRYPEPDLRCKVRGPVQVLTAGPDGQGTRKQQLYIYTRKSMRFALSRELRAQASTPERAEAQ